jgi:hypothetical protein
VSSWESALMFADKILTFTTSGVSAPTSPPGHRDQILGLLGSIERARPEASDMLDGLFGNARRLIRSRGHVRRRRVQRDRDEGPWRSSADESRRPRGEIGVKRLRLVDRAWSRRDARSKVVNFVPKYRVRHRMPFPKHHTRVSYEDRKTAEAT